MTADTQTEYQLIGKLRQIPLVEFACETSTNVYNKVKSSSNLFTWTLNSAEGAFALALVAVTPITNKLQQPIHLIDDTLCKSIDVLQDKVPLVKEQPGQIYETAKTYISHTAAVEKVQTITNKSWDKANHVLTSTTCGNLAMTGLDKTSSIADQYIDYFLPAGQGIENIHPHPNAQCEDKVLHTVHTVGTISTKMGQRVYQTITSYHSGSGVGHRLSVSSTESAESGSYGSRSTADTTDSDTSIN